MYYKIENKDCEVYQKLYELRETEKQINQDNIEAIQAKTGLTWHKSFGNQGQQNFRRVNQYSGFVFSDPEKVCEKTWKRHKEHNDVFVPNTRTKVGREMEAFLLNGLKASRYDRVLDILNLPDLNRFIFPYVEIACEKIIIFLSDNHEPTDPNVIEITKKEFEELRLGLLY